MGCGCCKETKKVVYKTVNCDPNDEIRPDEPTQCEESVVGVFDKKIGLITILFNILCTFRSLVCVLNEKLQQIADASNPTFSDVLLNSGLGGIDGTYNVTISSGNITLTKATRKYVSAALGDGVADTFTINHNLGTKELMIGVLNASSGNLVSGLQILSAVPSNDNSIVIVLDNAPTVGEIKIFLIG